MKRLNMFASFVGLIIGRDTYPLRVNVKSQCVHKLPLFAKNGFPLDGPVATLCSDAEWVITTTELRERG